MNIEEIKDYINSKKDKIKNGAIKATSTALVAGMLLSGGLGLTGCEKNPVIIDPNNPTQVTTNPNDSQNPNDSKQVTPSEDFKRVEFERPIEEYTGEEKVDIFVQNYCENNDFTYDMVQVGKTFDENELKSVAYVMFYNRKSGEFLTVHLARETFEQCAEMLGKTLEKYDRAISIDLNNDKESYLKIADFVWEKASESHTVSAREEKEQLLEAQNTLEGQFDKVMQKVEEKHSQFENDWELNRVDSLEIGKSAIDLDENGNEIYEYMLSLKYIPTPNFKILDLNPDSYTPSYVNFYLADISKEQYENLINKISVDPMDENGNYLINRKQNPEDYKMLAEYVLGILKQKYPDCFEDTMER